MSNREFTNYLDTQVPKITGAKGGKGGGVVVPNSLFSTDILMLTTALGEGPIYRINPNGPQDIQIQDASIDDLLNLDSDGSENTDKFKTSIAYGTLSQDPLPLFGDATVTPQVFGSPVVLKKGNLNGVPYSAVTLQETSANDWDSIRFNFLISSLFKGDSSGNVSPYYINIRITIYDSTGSTIIGQIDKKLTGKTDTQYKVTVQYNIASTDKSTSGYKFTIEKTSDDTDNAYIRDSISVVGWDEVKNQPQSYPRTALVGYALKATQEHTGGVPNFTSLVKGLIVKVPSNYNQPILDNGEIDWRELEVASSGSDSYTTNGYRQQYPGTGTLLTAANPVIYKGTWDGTFVYSWTQNPVWIIYDILTNSTYGLGIEESNIDKYKFYQVAQYCDACDSGDGSFVGVDGIADGSFRYKPHSLYTSVRENQIGLPKGSPIKERRFLLDVSITDQQRAIDVINKLAATFRGAVVYAGGKITLAVDMPDELPVMLFNETNIKRGSLTISGAKESGMYTGVDVAYIEPTNHFKREVVRIDTADQNDGSDVSVVENIASLDFPGITRRSQAIRMGQYHIAASKYLKRNINFTTNTDALELAPGDIISVATHTSGVAYGYGGKISQTSTDTNVHLEHFTSPSLSNSVFTSNTYPLALRVINLNSDKSSVYLISNSSFSLTSTDNVSSGFDLATVQVLSKYNELTRSFSSVSSFSTTTNPTKGDLWSIGEIENPGNYYTNKSDKLFKVTGVKRESQDEVSVTGIEYISNVYVDSDTFINYEPTAYVDIPSAFSVPPAPIFDFTASPRTKLDGRVVVDGILHNSTEALGFEQKYTTEYYVSYPDDYSLVSNVYSNSPLSISVANSSVLSNNITSCTLTGKNGYFSAIGEVPLLCNAVAKSDLAYIELTVEGLSSCYDDNFSKNILEVNDGSTLSLKGTDHVRIPVIEKSTEVGTRNFVGYHAQTTNLSRPITSYDLANNKIYIYNQTAQLNNLLDVIPSPPFYVSISQILANNYYSANSFYVTGSSSTIVTNGSLGAVGSVKTIDLDVEPRKKADIRLYIDGIQKAQTLFTFHKNATKSISSNIEYTVGSEESYYRVEVDYYSVPIFEVGDTIKANYGNNFIVTGTTFDTSSTKYDAALTSNNIYKIYTGTVPDFDLSGYNFTNLSPNPVGTIANVYNNNATLDFSSATYPGLFNLANNGVYTLHINSNYERLFLTEDLTLKELPIGTTSVKARSRSLLGRLSPFVERSIYVESLPIQKVQNITVVESLYREQNAGVAVRCTCEFDHITDQEVTDYEISYQLEQVDNVGTDDGGSGLTSYNTVKLPAAGVDSDGKMRFTINNINRGRVSSTNSLNIRITPLNKSIRGLTAVKTHIIVGKTASPKNIYGFTGGQQNEQMTFFWSYYRVNGDLEDLDLKEVIIKRVPGTVAATVANYITASPYVTISAGSVRKSIPIDYYGTYTYLARTRDTSGNYSDDVVGITLTSTRSSSSTHIAAWSEDDPSTQFTDIPNNNSNEYYYPSFANSTGGIYGGTAVDNANGWSSGWSTIAGLPTDILADADATYVTQIRDFGESLTGKISIDIQATQALQTTYNDLHSSVLSGVSEPAYTYNELYTASNSITGNAYYINNTAVFSCDVTFPNANTDGCLFEFGAATSGMYAGLRDSGNTFRIRAGNGTPAISTNADSTSDYIVLDVQNFPKDNAIHNLKCEIAMPHGDIKLWIDDEFIGQSTPANVFNYGIWAGLNTGSYLVPPIGIPTGESTNPWPGIEGGSGLALYSNQPLVSIFTDVDFGGIGHILGYNNTAVTSGRYDANNRTWMTGTSSGNVWAIWNHGQFTGDTSNANTYAYIAGLVNANSIALGETYFANGEPTGGNVISNLTFASGSYSLVNLTQFVDTGTEDTYVGTLGSVDSQTYIRTSSANTVYFANGLVDDSSFEGGFIPYEAGRKEFRFLQIKYIVNNYKPDQYDLSLDKFRYTIDKDVTVFSNTAVYDSNPKTIDISASRFTRRPVLSYSVLDQIDATSNPMVVVTTAASNSSVSFKLIAANGTGEYLGNSSANVMVTAVGV